MRENEFISIPGQATRLEHKYQLLFVPLKGPIQYFFVPNWTGSGP